MADVGGIQLLPETRRELKVKNRGVNKFFYSSIAIVSIVAALSLGLIFYRMSLEKQIDSLNQQLSDLEQQRDKKGEASLKVLAAQFGTITDLIKNHIITTQALDKLNGLMDDKVQVINFSVSVFTEKLGMKMRALNYAAVARQLASFLSGDFVKDVSLGTMGLDTKGNIEFTLELTIDKSKLFLKQ